MLCYDSTQQNHCGRVAFLTVDNWADLNTDTSFTCSFVDSTQDGLNDVQPATADTTVLGSIPDYADPYYIDFATMECKLVSGDSVIGTYDKLTNGCYSGGSLVVSNNRNQADASTDYSSLYVASIETLFDIANSVCYQSGVANSCTASIAFSTSSHDFEWTCDCSS